MKIVNIEQMRQMENTSAGMGISSDDLMRNAGLVLAEETADFIGDIGGMTVLILAGTGNNGGDGLIAAAHLSDWRAKVAVYTTTNVNSDPGNRLNRLRDRDIEIHHASDDKDFLKLEQLLKRNRIVIDALLGTGNNRPIEGTMAEITSRVAEEKRRRSYMKIVSVDVPSGVNADTGEADISSISSDVTITLGLPKIGLFKFPGAASVGELRVSDIGIPSSVTPDTNIELLTPQSIKPTLPSRPVDAHKGTFGKLLVIAGSERYLGAAYLACQSAIRAGTGLVTLAIPENLQHMLTNKLTEVTYLPLPYGNTSSSSKDAIEVIIEEAPKYQALLAGCGLGQSQFNKYLLTHTILSKRFPNMPMVLDADALNIMSDIDQWWLRLRGEAVVTPHLGEMSKLTGANIDDLTSSRIETATDVSKLWDKTVVLKGAHTVVSSPSGKPQISPFKNPGLASAGTGDVLAGIIAGLMAQGLSTFDAASAGVFIHGETGERPRHEIGDTGILASDILAKLPHTLRHIKEAY